MKVLTLKVPMELDARLTGMAARRGASKSKLVRDILSRALSQDDSSDQDSFLVQASDLCGCVAGPKDLSSNSAHLRGFGR